MAVYLDNAATSYPKPPRVYEQLRTHLERYGGCPGRGGYAMARESGAVVEATRHEEEVQRKRCPDGKTTRCLQGV